MSISAALESMGQAMLKPINPAAVVLLGVYTVVWGFWVANPFWEVFTTAPLYSALAGIIPAEWFWGCVAMVCGSFTIRGSFRRDYRSLLLGAGMVGWHWFMIAILYFLGDWQNTGGITSLMLALYASFVYLNIKVNGKRHNNAVEEILR